VAPNIRLVKNSAQMLQLQVQANNQDFFAFDALSSRREVRSRSKNCNELANIYLANTHKLTLFN